MGWGGGALLSESARPGFGMKGRKTPDVSQAPSPGWCRASDRERIHSLCQSAAKQANSCFERPRHLCNACRHHGVREGAAFQKAHATGTVHVKWEQGGSCSRGRGVDQIKSMSKSRETTS